jgi:hypothetical protein
VNTRNHELCEEAKLYYYDCLCDESCGLVPQSISNHVERCPSCQKQIDKLKVALSQKVCIGSEQGQDRSAVTTMLQLHFAYIAEHVTCETIRPFLPGLLDPDIEIRIPTPITVHLDNCPMCDEDLKAIQMLNLNSTQLYRLSRFFAKGPSRDTTEFSDMPAAVLAMAQRADSEVVTIYHVDESAKARKLGKADDLYAGFPISVEIIHGEDKFKKPVSTVNFATALKEKIAAMNLRPFLKIGVAVAAVMLIGFALLLNTPSAKAVTIQQIYKAIENVRNVYISSFAPGGTEPTQELWVSQDSGLYITRASGQLVVFDTIKRIKIIKNVDAATPETITLTDDIVAGMEEKIGGSLGLMPYNDISEIPPGSQLHRVDDQIPEVAEGIEIYDLNLTKATYGSLVFWKWRVFADAKTSLPRRVEWYKKFTDDAEFVLETVMVVEYLDGSEEIRKVIKDAGF